LYPQPIPTPIKNLRPARETCEQCHWPDKFHGSQERVFDHYMADEQNTRWPIRMLIKTGGGSKEAGIAEGIHWHMNIANRVEYIARDATRQDIPWVRITDTRTGESREYASTDSPLTEEERAGAEVRVMDCMDCHNRPSHIYRSPKYSMNAAMEAGRIDATLPAVKRLGIEVLSAQYPSTADAMRAIEQALTSFYREQHPEVERDRGPAVARAVSEIQQIYRTNQFPEMKVRWDTYADNIGHLVFPGCYRCHDGNHQSPDGTAITHACTACHTIAAQGKPEALEFATSVDGLTFAHPIDIGDAWQVMKCSDCHASSGT
jgi:hypothetical protein